MLNIPDEVKALFKADSVFKNFHVHFPNGENADLNNDDVVSESVEFTESICSQQSFRFGLTEASELKFTAVNIPNVRGATLEAALEIDIETLGSEWAEQHAPSGTESFLDPQVCTYGSRTMYRVPYGRFIVDTCPRNHEAMWKREITAYTVRMAGGSVINPFQIELTNKMYPEAEKYEPNNKALYYANIGNLDRSALTAGGYVRHDAFTAAGSYFQTHYGFYDSTGKRITVYITYVTNTYYGIIPGRSTNLLEIDMNGITYTAEQVRAIIAELLTELDVDPVRSGYESMEDVVDYVYGDSAPSITVELTFSANKAVTIHLEQKNQLIYPYFQTATDIRVATLGTIYAEKDSTRISRTLPSINVYEWRDGSPDDRYFSFGSTLQTKGRNLVGNKINFYSFANAFSMNDLIQGNLELDCRFCSPGRSGGVEITELDKSSPVPIVPAEYSELWYDETTVSPIGYVNVKFKGEDESEQDTVIQIGDGASVYDLTANEVLNNTEFELTDQEITDGLTVQDKILEYLNTYFVPNIPDLSFVPIELTKQGLPYLEAGDAIEITTGDGQTVPSFILRQTIKGIQFLTASVESANGEAVEMVES